MLRNLLAVIGRVAANGFFVDSRAAELHGEERWNS